MRGIVILCLVMGFLSGSYATLAQDISGGTVKYQRIANLAIEQGGEWAEFKKTLPKSHITNFILYFSDQAYQFVENSAENEAPSDMMKKAMWFAGTWGKPQVKLMKYYHHPEKKFQVRQTEFMTRLFREESELSKIKWKMATASKEILGYTCMLAETELDDQKIMAWFTPDIPISAGPERYYGLPGLMLEVNVNQGQVVWIASKVDLTTPNKSFLDEPKEGRKLTAEQYQKIQDDKIAEWEQQNKKKRSKKAVRIK